MTDTVNARILVRRDTTENWNAQRSFIPMRGEVIVYTDHARIDDGHGVTVTVPGMKIGDGSAYLIDLPFVGADVGFQASQELAMHAGNTQVHITDTDRAFWNNKLNCSVQNGNLILNRN